ncbi:MAG TPA: flagellar basal-body rod protein FlgF [Acidimicrobiales bacterium]|nr:flagellar basal-body rod protein FlgF [Acidimicrobiales bacterium]
MLRSMYSGVSGLRGHQTMMDVVGNNIANVNTTGYKSSQTIFQDLLSQVLQGAGMPEGAGGTNPAQVGLGMRLAGTSTNFTQGGLQNTGRSTDLAIQGDGFFAVRTGAETLYTRAGAFSFDAAGRLTTPQGAVVQGWRANPDGIIDTNAPVDDIVLPIGALNAPRATREIVLGGNLPADAAVDDAIRTSITLFDDQGAAVDVSFLWTKTATDAWEVEAFDADGTSLGAGTATFNPDGSANATTLTLANPPGSWSAAPTVTFGAQGQPLTQFAEVNTIAALSQNGAAAGSLQSFSISPDGVITGVFSNGRNQNLGQVALAAFNNPSGLEKTGGSMYRPTVNSGLVQIGVAGDGGRGMLAGGTLEMSNVDLAQEFTNLIVAQRGFQANSRVVTSSDELLQELVNMKR